MTRSRAPREDKRYVVQFLTVVLQAAPLTAAKLYSFKLFQMIVERLDIREDTHGVRFVPHLQHVVHLDEPKTVGLLPETQSSQFRTHVLTF